LGGVATITGALLDVRMRGVLTKRVAGLRGEPIRAETPAIAHTKSVEAQPMVPLLLELDGAGARVRSTAEVVRALEEVLDAFELRLGVGLPKASVHYGVDTGETRWRLLAFEAPIGEGAWIDPGDLNALREAVHQSLRRNAGLFIGIQEASNLLTRAGADYPEVVKEAARALPLARIAEVLRRLAEEEAPLRNMRDILEALADAGQREKDPFALTEFARVALRRQISHRYAPDGRLRAILLEPALEQHVREAIRNGGTGQQLALDPDVARRIIDAITVTATNAEASVLLTAIDLRRHVRKLIEPELFDLAVLSFHELLPSLKLDVAGRVAFPREPLTVVETDGAASEDAAPAAA
jgi:type III secretion protein V